MRVRGACMLQVEVTRLLVECYFDIVRANLQDAVPKALMHFLVLRVQRGLQQHLIKSMYRCACPVGAAPAVPPTCGASCTKPVAGPSCLPARTCRHSRPHLLC